MVSIILCTYNRAALLPNAIRSVLYQSYHDWELVIIDDGSTDDTYALVKKFQRKDKRITYHFQANRGLAEARNTGLRKVNGEYICFLDSDDELLSDHLEKRVKFLTVHSEIEFIHGGMKLVGPKTKQYVVDMTDTTRKIHLSKCHIGGTFFFRKKIIGKVKGFKPIPFGEDFDFYKRVEQSFSVAKVLFPTYVYHLDSDDRLCDIYTDKYFKMKKATGST